MTRTRANVVGVVGSVADVVLATPLLSSKPETSSTAQRKLALAIEVVPRHDARHHPTQYRIVARIERLLVRVTE